MILPCCRRHTRHTDYISDFTVHERDSCLLSVSGDATLSVIDLNKRCHRARSEDDNDDELLAVAVVKQGRKVLCGSQSGVINLFSWGHFKDCSDRFPGHPESVSAAVLGVLGGALCVFAARCAVAADNAKDSCVHPGAEFFVCLVVGLCKPGLAS